MKSIGKEINSVLKGHELRPTACRVSVLKEFIGQNHAISQSNLEKSLNNQFDRVTIYRTLNTFLENGIIHKVLDDQGSTKYAVCSEHCDGHRHDDQHVHFKCLECEQTFCIEEVSIPSIKLPSGYQFSQANLLIQGTCSACNHP